MTRTPLVTFVVPSYNHEQYIERLVSSVRAQTVPDFEAIIIDDASRDSSVDRIEHSIKGDDRFRLFRSSVNRGILATKNAGLELARGELVSIVDSDDVLPPNRTEILAEALAKHPEASLAYGDAAIIDADDRELGRFFRYYPPREGDFSRDLFLTYCFVPMTSVLFRRTKLLASGPLWGPPKSADYLKWIELGLLGDAILLRDKVLGSWRWHGSNSSGGSAESKFNDYHLLCEGLRELLTRNESLARRISESERRRRFARCYFMGGVYAAVEGNLALARHAFHEAFSIDSSAINRSALLSTERPFDRISPIVFRLVAKFKLGPFVE